MRHYVHHLLSNCVCSPFGVENMRMLKTAANCSQNVNQNRTFEAKKLNNIVKQIQMIILCKLIAMSKHFHTHCHLLYKYHECHNFDFKSEIFQRQAF